jgi:hypothetical protein
MSERLDENELWMLSFYRKSEIGGALFFARLANSLKPSAIQFDMTRHFADESRHAWQWTDCIARLGGEPVSLDTAYQDRYLRAAGTPANIMEVLAITHVFERRVFHHYSAHCRLPGLRSEIGETLRQIMADEKWHLAWVAKALQHLESEFGEDNIGATLKRFAEADRHVHRQLLEEHADRWQDLVRHPSNSPEVTL